MPRILTYDVDVKEIIIFACLLVVSLSSEVCRLYENNIIPWLFFCNVTLWWIYYYRISSTCKSNFKQNVGKEEEGRQTMKHGNYLVHT